MPEFWSTLLTLIIGGLVGQIFAPIFVARFSKTKQQTNTELAEKLSQISDKTAAQLLLKLEQVDKLELRTDEQDKEIEALQKGRAEREEQIRELQEQSEARGAEIAALKAQIEKETKETRVLRDEVELLRVQVAEGEAKYQEVAQKYNALKAYTEKLLKALREAGVEKLPDINGGLPDSIKGWRWDDPK